MQLTKTEYILRSISKIRNKKWEFFIVTRIIHALPDDIEFITQQLVRFPDGTRALTDLYFPQFNIHVEIDERFHEGQRDADSKRELDIIQVTEHSITRIKIADSNKQDRPLNEICSDVDSIVNKILALKNEQISTNEFCPWDFERRYSAKPVIESGIVSIKGNIVFQKQIEALRCFGFKGKGYQRGAWQIPDGSKDMVWFPRLYEHGLWHNELTADGKKIIERALNNNEEALVSIQKQKEREVADGSRKTIVFAKARDSLGFNLYRYVGTFRMNLDESTETEIIFDRVSEEEKVRVLASDNSQIDYDPEAKWGSGPSRDDSIAIMKAIKSGKLQMK